MKRVCDESRISNKHFINYLSFKLNIKQNKIHLPKTSLLPHRFQVPCSQSIGSKISKFSKDAIKYLSAKVGRTEKLFMYGPNFEIVTLRKGRRKRCAWRMTYFSPGHMLPGPPYCLAFKNGKKIIGLRKCIHHWVFYLLFQTLREMMEK